MNILAGLGVALLALTCAALSLQAPGALTVAANVWFVLFVAVSALVYLAAVALVLRRPVGGRPVGGRPVGRRAVWLVLLVAAALRLPVIPAWPFLSSDVNRYVWDGRVQMAGINPYRYIPDDPALTALRDEAVFPHINRADYAPTIYPPAAEMVLAAIAAVWPTVTGVKAAMVLFEVLAVGCLWRLLAAAGLPRERLLIYAWNPLPVWAFAGNGHIDAVAIGLVALALLLRLRRRDGWTGLVLGFAVATKFLPAVVGPALWRRGGGWLVAVVSVLTVVALYAVYSGVGVKVFGFLGGYGAEEGLDDGSGLWLLAGIKRLGPLPGWALAVYAGVALAVLGGLAAWVAFVRRPDDAVSLCWAAGLLMAALTFAISPHYPWYFAWLTMPAVVAPSPVLIWLGTAPVLLYLDALGDRFYGPSVVYVPALLLAVAGFVLVGRRRGA